MTTSEQNTTTGMSIETTAVTTVDTCSSYLKPSNQHLYFVKWIENRDCAILPPKEPILKSSCLRSETHKKNWSNDRQALSASSPSHRYHVDNHLSDFGHKSQSLALSTYSTKNIKRSASAQNSPRSVSNSFDKQRSIQDKPLKSALCSSVTTRQQKTNSRIPVLINKRVPSENKQYKISQHVTTDQPSLVQQEATLDNHSKIKNDHENQESLANRINHDNDQTVLVMSSHNDYDRETTTDAHCSETTHLDMAKLRIDEETKIESNLTNIKAQINTDLIQYEGNPRHDKCDKTIFAKLMKEQTELKAYYDSFPNIDDAVDDVGPNIKKAKEFTESILRKLPSGDVTDRDTLCHVLKILLGTEYQECLFYDSENGINLHDASLNLADINSEDRPFVLKLSSSEGLGNRNNVQTEQDDFELVQILTNVIEQKHSHPIIEDIIERLSEVHDVNKEDIVIKTVYVGTFDIVYTVRDLPINIIKSLFKIGKKLKKQFKQFISAKIHPLLYRPSFDIAYFDNRGNKSFPSIPETHDVGPPGRTKAYNTPSGWTRYGLKVLGKYSTNYWLDPFQHPENWYRAFHGTGSATIEDFGGKNQSFEKQYACVNALSSIYLNEFRKARVHAYGEGVYCSPNPQFPEKGYVQRVLLDTQKGPKGFICMLQVAVNPDGVKCTTDDDIWVVPNPKDIRPYGILIKEA